jgi:HEPN domain-containing protein
MPNRSYALEWLFLAKRNLETAQLLFREDHYTDIIGIELQQTVEKLFKSVYAYNGISIPKTHSLPLLYNQIISNISLDEFNLDDIIVISDYYETDRYPGSRYEIPPRAEIAHFLVLVEKWYLQIFEIASK